MTRMCGSPHPSGAQKNFGQNYFGLVVRALRPSVIPLTWLSLGTDTCGLLARNAKKKTWPKNGFPPHQETGEKLAEKWGSGPKPPFMTHLVPFLLSFGHFSPFRAFGGFQASGVCARGAGFQT